ncbi:MAG: OmpH family outer membrane protein [Balneolaceae bacterium]|nr:OmpH family outer membrane protein [Balneolaceae bacterium]
MKRLSITLLLLLVPLVASAQLKVAVMNPDSVLDAMPETAQVQSELEEYMQERQDAFQARYQDWINQMTEYSQQAEAGTLSQAEQQEEEARLSELQQELNSLQQRIQQQIQQRQTELFNPLLERVDAAMAEVCEERGLDYVINKTTNSGGPIVYYASDRAPDITQNVIDKLTQN